MKQESIFVETKCVIRLFPSNRCDVLCCGYRGYVRYCHMSSSSVFSWIQYNPGTCNQLTCQPDVTCVTRTYLDTATTYTDWKINKLLSHRVVLINRNSFIWENVCSTAWSYVYIIDKDKMPVACGHLLRHPRIMFNYSLFRLRGIQSLSCENVNQGLDRPKETYLNKLQWFIVYWFHKGQMVQSVP